jgi:LmbE family N-acetylglucosaminyl deacetylase
MKTINTSACILACIVVALSISPLWGEAQPARGQSAPRKLLAIFAHPDDETMVGPLLARYARQSGGVVYLALVTNGDKGVMPHAAIPADEQLAAMRIKEAECACQKLGAQPPILLGLPDGGINHARMLADLATKLEKLIHELRPDAIVTWGPDGGYGHADHRLVSAVITQVAQADEGSPLLYYAGLPRSQMPGAIAELRFPAPFAFTADKYLNVRVPYSKQDEARAREALACHKSQFTPQAMEQISAFAEKINRGVSYLRLWSGGKPRTDLFDR